MRKIIIANWKQNMNLEEVRNWLNVFGELISGKSFSSQIIISPSFPFLAEVSEFAKKYGLYVAAQNVSVFENGAHTGEVGASQIKNYCTHCIIGHSERKEGFEDVIKKRDLCLKTGITPVLCFSDESRVLDFFNENVIPTWEDPANISKNGQYNPKNVFDIETSIKVMKAQLPASMQILYGGSVNRQNAMELGNISQLDGVLVGNASLDPEHFFEIISAFQAL